MLFARWANLIGDAVALVNRIGPYILFSDFAILLANPTPPVDLRRARFPSCYEV
jgi:hypothetical protein